MGLELEYRFLGSESESGILYFLTWGRSPTKNKDSAFLVISGIFSQGTVAWGGGLLQNSGGASTQRN